MYSGITGVEYLNVWETMKTQKNNSNKPTPKETSEGVEVLQTVEEINPPHENPLHVWVH